MAAPEAEKNEAHVEEDTSSRVNLFTFSTCLMVASSGLIYGYDLVIAGGVSIQDDFLRAFFPEVLKNKQGRSKENHDSYCEYDNQVLQLFSSSLCLAAFIATFGASVATKRLGHPRTMLMAGALYAAGSTLGALATNLELLILNRVLLGAGLGFGNQAAPLYLSEIAPAKKRGMLNLLFSLNVATGILTGNVINYIASHVHPWGWRLSLAVNGLPAILLIVVSIFFLVETPISLIANKRHDEAKSVLKRLRGTNKIDGEYDALLESHEASLASQQSWRSILRAQHKPQLIIGVAMPFFQQMTGFDSIIFYGPSLFNAAGFGDNAALYSTVITGTVAFISTVVAILVVDRWGRRGVLLSCTSIMFLLSVVLASMLWASGGGNAGRRSAHGIGAAEVVVVGLFVFAYKASWGPLAWLVPSEVYSGEVRSIGQSVTVSTNMLVKFAVAQSFLSMLCAFRYGMFLFFAGWLLLMGVFTYFLIPETKGVAIHKMGTVWEKHWFWRRYTLPTGARLQTVGMVRRSLDGFPFVARNL